MSLIHEAYQDLLFLKETRIGNIFKEFVFTGSKGPIVALPGVSGGWTKFGLRSFMQENDISGVLCYFDKLKNGLDLYIDPFKDIVDKYPNAVILGFSAGGVIALKYGEKYGWDKVKKIITVASPIFGSPPAKLLSSFGETYSQLSPNSEYLKGVIKISTPKGKVLSVFSEYDIKAPFSNIQTLNWPIMVLESKSHGQIHEDHTLLKEIIENTN